MSNTAITCPTCKGLGLQVVNSVMACIRTARRCAHCRGKGIIVVPFDVTDADIAADKLEEAMR